MDGTAFDLSATFVHLGTGGTATELPGFTFSAEYLRGYLRRFLADRDDGRLVGIVGADATWTHWECHAGGDELVVQLTGRSEIVQEIDGGLRRVALGPGQGMINPRGVWHTSDVHEPGQSLFVAGGRRTLYRPRRDGAATTGAAPA